MSTTTAPAYDIVEGTVPLHAHLQLPTKALIEWVNQAFETEAIMYWIDDAKSSKRASLEIGGLTHNYCYQFEVLAGSEFDDAKWHQIDVSVILRGLSAITSGSVSVNRTIRGYVLDGVLEAVTDGTGALDSDALDAVIQAGLFGEVIYG